MPKLEPKLIQRELDQGLIWPVYWLYGQERMKTRELLRRIRKAVLGEEALASTWLKEESFDGSQVECSSILDAAMSLSFGGGARLIVVRDAHQLKDLEELSSLFGPKAKKDELASVCVFISRDLDGRKKFSKQLIEKAAVVPCEEVLESERDPWIQYLAKRKGLELLPEVISGLLNLDPWNLDIVDLELEKISIAGPEVQREFYDGFGKTHSGTEAFLNAFLSRSKKSALPIVEAFADAPDESLPLLGLLGWNVRQLIFMLVDPRGQSPKMNPYRGEQLRGFLRQWKLDELLELQSELSELDFGLKQKPLLPLGLWASLVARFCRA